MAKNILDTACYVIHLNFSADYLIIYISLSLWMCMYTENKFNNDRLTAFDSGQPG